MNVMKRKREVINTEDIRKMSTVKFEVESDRKVLVSVMSNIYRNCATITQYRELCLELCKLGS